MSLQSQANELLREYDLQTPVGKFAQSVLDYLEDQLNPYGVYGPFSFTKVSQILGATRPDFKYEGTYNHKPKVGQSFHFFYGDHVITTSTVKEVNVIDSKNTEIKTLNSVYMLSIA